MKTAFFLALITFAGCAHWDYHAQTNDVSPTPTYYLLTRDSAKVCEANDDFDEVGLLKKARYTITNNSNADGVLNCMFKVEPTNDGESCLYMTCRPYVLSMPTDSKTDVNTKDTTTKPKLVDPLVE